MENLENISIEFTEKIKRFSADFDSEYENLNQLDKEDFNLTNLESWETTLFLLVIIEKVRKDISITQWLTSIRENLLNLGVSLPKASYIVLRLNLEINI